MEGQNLIPNKQLTLLNSSFLCPGWQVFFFLPVMISFYALRIMTCFPANGSWLHMLSSLRGGEGPRSDLGFLSQSRAMCSIYTSENHISENTFPTSFWLARSHLIQEAFPDYSQWVLSMVLSGPAIWSDFEQTCPCFVCKLLNHVSLQGKEHIFPQAPCTWAQRKHSVTLVGLSEDQSWISYLHNINMFRNSYLRAQLHKQNPILPWLLPHWKSAGCLLCPTGL